MPNQSQPAGAFKITLSVLACLSVLALVADYFGFPDSPIAVLSASIASLLATALAVLVGVSTMFPQFVVLAEKVFSFIGRTWFLLVSTILCVSLATGVTYYLLKCVRTVTFISPISASLYVSDHERADVYVTTLDAGKPIAKEIRVGYHTFTLKATADKHLTAVEPKTIAAFLADQHPIAVQFKSNYDEPIPLNDSPLSQLANPGNSLHSASSVKKTKRR